MSLIHRSLCICTFVLLSMPVFADDGPPLELYDNALEAHRSSMLEQAPVCAFSFTTADRPGETFRFLAGPDGETAWVDASGETPESLAGLPGNAIRALQPARSLFDSRVEPRFLRWDGRIAVYEIRKASFTVARGNAMLDVADHVVGEAGVDADAGVFTYLEISAPESFKPNPAVRFRHLEMRREVEPAFPGGPLIHTRDYFDLLASAMFQTHEMSRDWRFFDFEPCES